MPKSAYTAEELYADTVTRTWIREQDWKAKFGKLAKKKRAAFEKLAAQLNGEEPKKVRRVKATVTPTKEAEPKSADAKKSKSSSKGSGSSDKATQARKNTGYSVYAKRIRQKMKDEGVPLDQIPAKEMRKNYNALKPERKERYEAHAAKLNE